MSPLLVLITQMTLTLIIISLIANWFVSPRLSALPIEDGLVPLVFIHTLRYVLLAVLVPGVADSTLPVGGTRLMAYGDFATALLALLAVLALRFHWPGRFVLTWIFSIVGVADIINALIRILEGQLYNYNLGTLWFIITFFAPILVVSHVMIFLRLTRGSGDRASTRPT